MRVTNAAWTATHSCCKQGRQKLRRNTKRNRALKGNKLLDDHHQGGTEPRKATLCSVISPDQLQFSYQPQDLVNMPLCNMTV